MNHLLIDFDSTIPNRIIKRADRFYDRVKQSPELQDTINSAAYLSILNYLTISNKKFEIDRDIRSGIGGSLRAIAEICLNMNRKNIMPSDSEIEMVHRGIRFALEASDRSTVAEYNVFLLTKETLFMELVMEQRFGKTTDILGELSGEIIDGASNYTLKNLIRFYASPPDDAIFNRPYIDTEMEGLFLARYYRLVKRTSKGKRLIYNAGLLMFMAAISRSADLLPGYIVDNHISSSALSRIYHGTLVLKLTKTVR